MNAPPDHSPAAIAAVTIRFGLWSLLAYLTLGLALEALHGFKVAWYLEFETRRLLWTLAHAHGVLVSVLAIVFGLLLQRTAQAAGWHRLVSACLMAAAVLLPGPSVSTRGLWISCARTALSRPYAVCGM